MTKLQKTKSKLEQPKYKKIKANRNHERRQ